MDVLPNEILYHIFENLEIKNLHNLMGVNKRLNLIASKILLKNWKKLLQNENIQISNIFENNSLNIKELKIYIKLTFLLKRKVYYYERISLTLINTNINKEFFNLNSMLNGNHFTLMLYCTINLYNIEKMLCSTKINNKFIRIKNISKYFYNNKSLNYKNEMYLFRDHYDTIDFGHVTYFLKTIHFV